MLHTKIKKTLIFAFIVMSTLIYVTPAGANVPKNNKQLSPRTAAPNKNTGNNNKSHYYNQLADRGKPGNPIPAGRR